MVVYAVIAAKDEAETIGVIVRDLKHQDMRVIVVDDGSTDGTGSLAAAAGAEVIRNPESAGIGKAFMAGWKLALDCGADYVVQLDAGGSHYPHAARRLLEMAQVYGLDVVVGSRFCQGARYIGRPWRAFASKMAAHLMNFAGHYHLTDWTSGYRVFSATALEFLIPLPYFTNMHGWNMEVLARAKHLGLKVADYPITYCAGRSALRLKAIDEAVSVFLWVMFL